MSCVVFQRFLYHFVMELGLGITTTGFLGLFPTSRPLGCHTLDKFLACGVVKLPVDTAKPGRILVRECLSFSGSLAMSIEVRTLRAHGGMNGWFYVKRGRLTMEAAGLERMWRVGWG